MSPRRLALLLLSLALLFPGCSSARYAAWEKIGWEKRDLLERDVRAVKSAQEDTGEQFRDALDELRALYGSSGSDLERRYDAMRGEYEDCEAQATKLRERIRKVRTVAGDLFSEWEDEIDSMQNASYQQASRRGLAETRRRYAALDAAMRRSEEGLDPVLVQFRDQVLFLKHHLNAQSLGTLEDEVRGIDAGVAGLIERMQASIREADAFLQAFE
jgi:chromosome segregation ATPase